MPRTSDDRYAPSGQQIELVRGASRVTVVGVGGGLRRFDIDGIPVLFGYGRAEMCSGGRGQVLAPWPNRLEDGEYDFTGVHGTAALDEPERHNAIHGLVRWLGWSARQESESEARLSLELQAQPGYPWRIALEIGYGLVSAGRLEVTVSAENRSSVRAPFGIGFHPYLDPGGTLVDDCTLAFSARRIVVLSERGLPTSVADASGEDDFSRGRRVGEQRLDSCFTGIEGGPDGRWRVEMLRGDGRRVALSADGAFSYLMCYTADTLAGPDRRRGLALEPMTCPPNALRTGAGVITLEPEALWHASWALEALDW